MIGSLMYLTARRPGIMFSVGLCGRFQANPKESHVKLVEGTLRYLKEIPDLCLWYPRGYTFDLVGYANADYVGFHVDRKSTFGAAHFLGSYLVSRGTNKYNLVALSKAEVDWTDDEEDEDTNKEVEVEGEKEHHSEEKKSENEEE
ncbi:secreted RxLR effector protein 161-like [Nicotiana tomentosiformis]|uniref:secreted RxLR effector protein 161-like n=1 Tax=Nicotiana tomentosiformis TaxID=4098 RepID=UPI00388C7DCF